jgi:hypothetical protein
MIAARRRLLGCSVVLLCGALAQAAEPTASAIEKGQRVFSAGHSFHMFVPALLREMAQAAGIEGHVQAGTQGIGGSRVIQHWDRPDETNTLKKALRTGEVDVLTLSPIYLPDEGIENLARLGLEHNPNIRITIQEFWLPYDVYDLNYQRKRPEAVDRNARTADELRSLSAEYFKSMDEHVAALNNKFSKQVLFVVPVGQAVIALREKIINGEAPGLKAQNDLFTDPIGHATPPLQALTAYCHFAVIYRRSPVGLPRPSVLTKNAAWGDDLNRLLQELAWDAVRAHRHSGVTKR